jgi:SET domain-containing protein
MDVYVADAKGKGRGVFAARRFERQETIEVCPIILIPKSQRKSLENTVLYNYHFKWEDDAVAVCLGLGSLYNHSYKPNALYRKDFPQQLITFVAIRQIQAHEEITVNYKGHPDSTKAIWFEMVKE